MTAHPCADLFPLIEGREFDELVEDIRKFGLRTPILVDGEGRVLDGRNRLRACRQAGVEPHFETWNGRGSEAELVVSMNLHRRHLNESQRAMVAAKLKEMLAPEALERQRTGRAADLGANLRQGRSSERAAGLLNVSRRSVEHASKLLKRGDPELIHAVQSGQMAVSAAAAERVGGENKKPKTAVRPDVKIAALAADEVVLAMCAPRSRLADAKALIEQWGFQPRATRRVRACAGSPPEALLFATRRNPLAGG